MVLAGGIFVSLDLAGAAGQTASEPGISAPPPAWPTSPYHGVIDGDGKRIPCLCRFRETDYRLGDTVCMNTHLGVQLARCDLFLNNTSWIPIGVPCTMSRRPGRLAHR
jgi:hypothetical protein